MMQAHRLVLVLILVSGCVNESKGPTLPPSDLKPSGRVVTLYGGAAAIDTVQQATSVQVYRITTPMNLPVDRIEKLSDYTDIAGPIDVSFDTVAKLRAVLMDDKTYIWDTAKACGMPDYGVRFHFQRGSDQLDVLICFHCDIAGIYHNGKLIEDEDCDDGRSQLVGLAKALFPDDAVIQSLKVKSY